MDIEYDSDLEGVPEFEISQEGEIRPYMFEPMRRSASGSSSESDREDSDSDSLSSSDDDDDADIIPDVSSWCMCNNCRKMPTLKESKCCQTTNIVDGKIESEGLGCITEHEGFIVNCLNRYVLETSYYDYRIQNGPLEENQLVHEVYRYIAYRRFTRWVYGLLGKRHRKVIPSCAVIKIREAFPSQEYCGFKYPE